MHSLRSVRDADVAGKRVLVRADLNVPLEDGRVADDTRIRAALPTIRHMREAGARIALASHLGRPKGRELEYSLEPVAAHLARLLDDEVRFADDCVGDGVQKVVKDLPAGGVAILENLRFHKAEQKGDLDFARLLSAPFEVYVNDAFGTSHRPDVSMYASVQFYPKKAAGFLLEKEIKFLGQLLGEPARPFVAILGGAKVSDKIGVIRSLLSRCDALLIGGAMAYTLLAAQGHAVGTSLVESDKLDLAKELVALAASRNMPLVLPLDHVVAAAMDAAEGHTTAGVDIPDGMAGYDIGPKTVARFLDWIGKARTVFWNGPLGVFEKAPFSRGTFELARALAAASCVSVVGGGDSAAAVAQAGVEAQISHVSTGGGAALEFLEDRPLPGIEALRAGHQFAAAGP
jgi:phosphoglycerate kinase